MEVILLQDVPHIGKRGVIKNVSDGFARNFLLPKKLAAISTPALKAAAQKESAQEKQTEERKKAEFEKLAASLKDVRILFQEKANEEGTLFSGVTREKIVQQLQAVLGQPIQAGAIQMEKPLKHTGEHTVLVRLHDKEYPIIIDIKP